MQRRTRVVFAVHRVPTDDDVLLALPFLSGSQQLQIQSVLIRDTNLVRAAALPATQEVLPSGTVRKLSSLKVDEHFAAMANRLRERVEMLAARHGYPATFREVEGQDYSALEPLTENADFVAITRPDQGAKTPDQIHADSPIRCRKTTLFINEPWMSGSCVLMAYEGSQSESALDIADRYAQQARLPLVVVAPENLDVVPIEARHRVQRVSELWNDATMATLCRRHDARLLVLGEASQSGWQDVARLLIESVPCSILQVVPQSEKETS